MKKILLFSVVVLCALGYVEGVFAYGACGSNEIEFQGNQDYYDDEFVYSNKDAFNSAKIIDESDEGKGSLKGGVFYECDNEQGCRHGAFIAMKPGHVIGNDNEIGVTKLYRCTYEYMIGGNGDYWKELDVQPCESSDVIKIDTVGTDTDNSYYRYREKWENGDYVYCYKNAEQIACEDAKKRGEPANWNGYECNCGDVQKWDSVNKKCIVVCEDDETWDAINQICVPKVSKDDLQCSAINVCNDYYRSSNFSLYKDCIDCCRKEKDGFSWDAISKTCQKNEDDNGDRLGGNETPGSGKNPTCTQRYGCYSLSADKQKACVACCSVSSAVANWNPIAQTCECVDKSQNFDPVTKMCSGGSVVNPPVVTMPEPETYRCDLNKLLELRNKYSNNSEVVRLIDDLIKKCNEGISETEYNNLYINITVIITNIQNTTISSSKTKISNAVAKLNKIASDFNTSVWKNAEGKFNTSRLISDSVAGVVLGTAGGLITSSVVKKNQVESGFEDIQCTVGGQVVAGWGDQFRVGIQ